MSDIATGPASREASSAGASKAKKGWLIALLVVGLIVAVGYGLFLFWRFVWQMNRGGLIGIGLLSVMFVAAAFALTFVAGAYASKQKLASDTHGRSQFADLASVQRSGIWEL